LTQNGHKIKQKIDKRLTKDWQKIDKKLTKNWHKIDKKLTKNWQTIDKKHMTNPVQSLKHESNPRIETPP